MPVEFLPAAVRSQFGHFVEAPSPMQLAHHFHLDGADRERLAQYRSDHNRLGYALQLGTVRFLGTFATDLAEVPDSVVWYVSDQLEIADPVACLRLYANVDTQRRHARDIREAYGYHQFHEQPYHFTLTRWLLARAWLGGERPIVLFDGATGWLVERKVLLPGASVLERLVARARSRADTRVWRLLSAAPDADQKARLKLLLKIDDTGQSKLDTLRRAPRRLSSRELVRALNRLTEIRTLGASALDLNRIPARRIRMLARYAAAARAQAIARMPEEHQIATLVAFAREYEVLAQDDALDLFDLLLAKLLNEARDDGQRERLKTLGDLDEAAMTLARACQMLLGEGDETTDIREAIFAQVPRDELLGALETVDAISRPQDDLYYDQLAERYRTVRHFLPTFLKALQFESVDTARGVIRALDFLASIEGKRAPDMGKAPLGVVTGRWRPLVIRPDGQVDRTAYTFCVLDQLRAHLRRRDVFVSPSYRWIDPRAKLLSGKQWESLRPSICRSCLR